MTDATFKRAIILILVFVGALNLASGGGFLLFTALMLAWIWLWDDL